MTIVIDVGCARYGGDYSIERLLDEFEPDFLFGFDPNWNADMFEPPADLKSFVVIETTAAWTYDGDIGFISDGLNSTLSELAGRKTPCFDLARWMWEDMPAIRRADSGKHRVVLKMDAEGSEYELLEHLIERKADALVNLAWIEWHEKGVHNPIARRKWIEENWRGGEVMEWLW